jgi:hypothetical protein
MEDTVGSDFLDRYQWEAEAHANELLELMTEDERAGLRRLWFQDLERLEALLRDPPKTAYVLLGENPSVRDRRIAKLPRGEFGILWLQARYLALRSARAMQLAARVAYVKGMKYRQSVRYVAQDVLPLQDQIETELSLDDLLWLQLPD